MGAARCMLAVALALACPLASASASADAALRSNAVASRSSQAVAGSKSARAAVTPISKVLELLKGLLEKGKAEKEAEAERFAAFDQWCAGTSRVKANEISAAAERIGMLEATIQKDNSRSRSLSERVAELEEDVARWEKDRKSAADVRGKEAADYAATATDYSESLSALDDAIAALKKQAFSRSQAEALLQVQGLKAVPIATKQVLAAFLQQAPMPDERLFNAAPEAYGYEFQSGGVVDMLEKLKSQFQSKKYELDQEELRAKHAFELIMQQLADNIENARHEASRKEQAKSEADQSKAESEAELARTKADKAEDEAYLKDAEALCASKKSDFESRTALRAQEITALEKAIEVISSESVAGSGDKHLPALLQSRRSHGGVSFAQLRSVRRSGSPNALQSKIASFLADRARSCHSQVLALMSQRVATDPFEKVKKMIKDLISKLMEEGTAETEHKGWCDTELATNKVTREAKTSEIGRLSAEEEGLTAQIAQLTQDISDLASASTELAAAMAAAEAERTASKENNAQTVTEAKEAQAALERAIAVVKDYYAQSAEATALLQRTSSSRQNPGFDAPETFDAPYQGMMPEGGTVVDFLEVILSDFTRLEVQTSNSEASAQEAHEAFMFESKKDKALKDNEAEHKTSLKTDKESALHAVQQELKATQEQLNKAVTYHDKLQPTCIDSGITYEERVRRREEEIQSLEEALKILTGTDVDLS